MTETERRIKEAEARLAAAEANLRQSESAQVVSSSPWVEVSTDDGRTYYHNTETDETSWDPPPSAPSTDRFDAVLPPSPGGLNAGAAFRASLAAAGQDGESELERRVREAEEKLRRAEMQAGAVEVTTEPTFDVAPRSPTVDMGSVFMKGDSGFLGGTTGEFAGMGARGAAAAAERKVGFKPPPPKGPKRGSQGPSPADRQTMAVPPRPPRKSQPLEVSRVPLRKSAPPSAVPQRPGIIAQLSGGFSRRKASNVSAPLDEDGPAISPVAFADDERSAREDSQREALLRIMDMMAPNSDYRDSWGKTNRPISQFKGLTFDEAGRLVGLDLNHADIEADLGDLGRLLGKLPIQMLNLSFNPHLVGDVKGIAKLNLVTLSLRGCYRVTGDLETIGTHLTGLQSLDLINCRELRGSVKSLMSLKGCTEINLYSCVNIKGPLKSFASMPNLKTLCIANCPKITGKLKAVVEFGPNLAAINLAGTDGLTGDQNQLEAIYQKYGRTNLRLTMELRKL